MVNRIALVVAGAGVVLGSAYMMLLSSGKKTRGERYVMGKVNYQAEHVPASVLSSGKVYVDRTTTGADNPPVGEAQREVIVPIRDARGLKLSLDANGVMLVGHAIRHIDYEDIGQVASAYYPECCRLVKEHTGAVKVIAFDHNLRGSAVQSWMNKSDKEEESPKLSQQYQSPAGIVHGDYTITSAPLRLRMLSQPPKLNDTWASTTNGKPLISQDEVEQRLKVSLFWAYVYG